MLYLISVFRDKLNTLHKCRHNVTNRVRYYIENLIEILTKQFFEKIYVEIFIGSMYLEEI